jgi:DNA-binding transcriptional ArsR family regulator
MGETGHACLHGEHGRRDLPSLASDDALESAARLHRAMGDRGRLRLLELLAHGEWCVGELVAHLGEKFSTVSQRLRVLRGERLVVRRREGTHLYYTLADRHVADLVQNALAHATEPEAAATPTAPGAGRSRGKET